MRTTEIELSYKVTDEYGEVYEDSETITCTVESIGCSEYCGVYGSDGNVVDMDRVISRAVEIIEDTHHYGGKVLEMLADGEPLEEVDIDKPDGAEQAADEADFRRDEVRDEQALEQLKEVG